MNAEIHEQLLQAVKEGDVETAKSLLDGIDTSELGKFYDKKDCQNSLLHVAAENAQCDNIKLLLDKLDVNSLTDQGETALMLAIDNVHHETVKLLFDSGADLKIPKLLTYTDLLKKVEKKTRDKEISECIKDLLEGGSNKINSFTLDPNYLTIQLWEKSLKHIMCTMYMKGHETNNMILSCEKNKAKFLRTSIELAVQKFHVKENRQNEVISWMKMYISCANDDLKNKICNEGLLHSIDLGSISIVQFFLDQGANVNYCNDNYGVLTCAIGKKSDEIVRYLLDNGADCNATCSSLIGYEYPLTVAIKSGSANTLEAMLENYGCDINIDWNRYLNQSDGNEVTALSDEVLSILNYTRLFLTINRSEIFEVLMKHIVKLQEEKKFVAKELLSVTVERADLLPIKEKCMKEIELIKEQKIDSFTKTLYELWNADLVQLTGYLRNKNVIDFVTSEELTKKFPIYSFTMHSKFQKGLKRIHLLKRVCNFFLSLSTRVEHRLPKLPATCVNEIFHFLNDKDLIHLRAAYY